MHIQLKTLSSFFLLTIFSFWGQAQKYQEAGTVLETHATYLGTTSPLKDLIPIGPISKEKKEQWKRENKIPRNFLGRGLNKVTRPELEHQGPDKLRQGIIAGPKSQAEANLLLNYDGITNGSPNDPSGDIGRDHYVLAINATEIAVYDKGGNELTTFAANTLWQEIGFSSAGDPIVLYDQLAHRWIITEFPSGNQLLVAISENSDPTGSYDVYNFQTPNFPDYPKYGIWDDVITVTTNEQGGGNLTCYFINKQQLYKGDETVQIQRLNLPGNTATEAGFFVATPVDWMGQTPPKSNDPIFLNIEDSSWDETILSDQIRISTIDIDWGNPNNTSFTSSTIITSPFDSNPCSVSGFGFSCIPQAGNGGGLDGIPEVIMNQAIYRNFNTHEVMVFNFITDVTDGDNLSGIRWIELRREEEDWYLYQEGTFSPQDGLDRWMGGIAMDGSGNIGLAYNVASEEEFVGVRFTGRKWDDPLGEMTVPEQILAEGVNTISSGARFGDYAQMGVDPVNDRTFWYVTEYGKGPNSSSSTRVVAFELEKDSIDIAAFRWVGPTSDGFGLGEEVSIEIKNYGTEDVNNFEIGFIFENEPPVVEMINSVLPSGGSIIHTFNSTIDFTSGGEFVLTAFTNLNSDAVSINDSTKVILTAIAELDAGFTSLSSSSSISCSESVDISFLLQNFGADTLESARIDIILNGDIIETLEWTGELAFCEGEIINFTIPTLMFGNNIIEVEVSNPNNGIDMGPMNNGLSTAVEYLENSVEVNLNFTFDQYPEETTWQVTDSSGTIIYSGGPYPSEGSATEVLCLDADGCFTFTIFDSYGDGIFAPGGYEIVNPNGQVLASIINNNFGTQESNSFCAEFMCMLEVDINVTPAGDNGGTILLTPQNGIGPFQYSIDGGNSFQDNGLFENVDIGIYDIVVTGAEDCEFLGSAEVEECSLNVVVEFENATEIENGSISFNVSGGIAPYEYSIDGGENWQSDFFFEDVEAGDYELRVRDANGCIFEDQLTIQMTLNSEEEYLGIITKVTPNPTQGIFRITMEGDIPAGQFIQYEIYDATGIKIRTNTLTKYDNEFTAMVTLQSEPSGMYYIKIKNESLSHLLKIVKL